jgi:trimeric autotransporter adhesin
MFKYLSFFGAFMFFLAACSKKAADTPLTTIPERLELSPATTSVVAGGTTNFSVTFYNNTGVSAAVPSGITWSSLDNNIATVNQQGVVTGVAAGQTSIRVSYNAISATALISVTSATVPERLEISSTTNTVMVGASVNFTLTYFNNQGVAVPVPAGVTWSSLNNGIATVNQQGVVTGSAPGQTSIRASLNSITATALITVTNPTVLERLEISPGNTSIAAGSTATFALTYYNNQGMLAPVPPGVAWSSTNNTVATVNQQGVATGVAGGQTNILATVNSLTAAASLTVTANNQLATVTLTPSTMLELNLNQVFAVTATGRNINGDIINGLVFTWASSDNSLVTVDNTGMVRGVGYGTTTVTATAASITSPPLMVQVIRSGSFNGGSNSAGQAKLKIENGVLKLQTSANFSVNSGPPDLRIYLSNSTSSISNAVEVATLNQRSGAQTWNVPATNAGGQPVTITSYPFVLVWCRQFGGNYGHVVLP